MSSLLNNRGWGFYFIFLVAEAIWDRKRWKTVVKMKTKTDVWQILFYLIILKCIIISPVMHIFDQIKIQLKVVNNPLFIYSSILCWICKCYQNNKMKQKYVINLIDTLILIINDQLMFLNIICQTSNLYLENNIFRFPPPSK